MENTDNKLIKVTFEYENGEKHILSKGADQWLKKFNRLCIIAKIHNFKIFEANEFNWEITKPNNNGNNKI